MNAIDAQATVEYMKKLWPKWNPTDVEADVWEQELRGHEEQTAVRALREAKFKSNFNSPPTKDIRSLLTQYMPTTKRLNPQQDDTKDYLLYRGGGQGPLLAGWFCVGGNDLKLKYEQEIGGEWEVHTGTTHGAMNKMRCGMRAELANMEQ